MKTPYDFITVAIFAVIALVYLQRSLAPPPRNDHTFQYVLCALGCAGANWLGNEGHDALAIPLILATAGYFLVALKPFRKL